ncbi:MAG: DNA-3-methyladenine glycosylase 2 [Pyrinomonadaceae bacterium]
MTEMTLPARAPFDFAATARSLRFTDAEVVDTFRANRYARALHFGEQLFLLTVEAQPASTETGECLALNVKLAPEQFATPQILDDAARIVRSMFSLDHDLAAGRARIFSARDSLLRRLEVEHRGLHLARWPSLFEALLTSILLQQIATAVAVTFRRRVVERYGERLEAGGDTFYAFPRAETMARAGVADLRALGLSNAKAMSIIELARACVAGELNAESLEREDNESIIARLSSLRGVGRWTAEWVLMLYFGRTDVFPATDLFLRGAVVKYYNKGMAMNEREIRAFAQKRWGAWSSYAALYFLAGMRAGAITLKPERVLSSRQAAAKNRAPTGKLT